MVLQNLVMTSVYRTSDFDFAFAMTDVLFLVATEFVTGRFLGCFPVVSWRYWVFTASIDLYSHFVNYKSG